MRAIDLGAACCLFTVAAFQSAAPAAAESTPIPIGQAAIWKNEQATLEMPPQIAGFTREGIVDYGDQRLDVAGRYQDHEGQTAATLYLYRAPIPDASLWHDRALAWIRQSDTLGTPDVSAAVTAPFVPPHSGGVASGLRTVMPLAGTDFRSTAVAIFPLGEWLVKIRMSSKTLDTAGLTARLDAFVAGLAYQAPAVSPPAAAMADCVGALPTKAAKRARQPDIGTQLLLSTFASMAQEKEREKGEAAAPPAGRYCRDAATQVDLGVYRWEGADDAYVLALGDAGVSAAVYRQPAVGLLGGDGGKDFWVDLSTPYQTATYRGFHSLPRPDQVVEVIETESPVTSAARDGSGDTTINLTPD